MPIGAHVSTSGGLPKAVERARMLGAECMQVFLHAPQRWGQPRHTDEEVEGFVSQAQAFGIGPNFAHARYVINLASADTSIRQRSIEALATCATWAERCRLDGVVLHLGSGRGQPVDEAERQVAGALQQLFHRGGAVDRHENIGLGLLGSEALRRMLTHPALADLPWVLEVPGFDDKGPDEPNVRALKRLAGRRGF